MEQEKILTFEELMERYALITSQMTQEQVDACAWLMGCSGTGWTPEILSKEFKAQATRG